MNDGVFNDDGKSKKAIIGSEKDVEIAMELFDAYTNLDSQRMVELSKDIVKFHPAEIAGIIDVDASNTSFIDQIQSTFESIDRTVHNVTPIAVEGSDNYTVVGINYTQVITHKDGSISSGHYFERIHVENEKVVRIVQWMRPLE
ncbi:MAG: nuclear transport factor 2 family protein [Flavobacteriaceae bacterium]|nr:nuclear transport factor 2 family protein [Flavobacteriaceae bacterium]